MVSQGGICGAARRHFVIIAGLWIVWASHAGAQPPTYEQLAAQDRAAIKAKPFAEDLLWYIPNRLCDLADLFRARVRVGPGLAANVRLTDYGAFYAGSYSSVYLGLPGSRANMNAWSPVGFESLDGIVLFGVDATDDNDHGPRYSATEVDVGAHLLLVGAEVGFDPVELADFICGLVFLDIRADDYFWERTEGPEVRSAISVGPGVGPLRVDPKPDTFDSWGQRLDYLQTNVTRRVDQPVRTVDEYFAAEGVPLKKAPQTRLRLGLYAEAVDDEGTDITFEPDFKVEVELPNIENRLNLFIESAREDDLPGKSLSEQERNGVTVGVGKWIDGYNISADAGIRTRWPPELYGRLSWRPQWKWGEWRYLPEQRFFWESEDGFGSLTQLGIYRWMGARSDYFVSSRTAGKITEESDGFEWEQTVRGGRVLELLDEGRRGRSVSTDDLARGYGLRYSIFGEDDLITKHRVGFGYRFPLYRRWVFGDIRPGVEWSNEDDWATVYRVDFGVDLLFWGAGYE